jgi:hypothetical protein
MNSKSTWVWITIAAVLFAAVVGVEKFWRKPPPGLVALLPGFKAGAVTSVQYTPAGQLEIRADRTNQTWQLVKPITFPAQAASIDALLTALQQLAPAQTISGAELRQHPNADAEFGFNNRSTLTLLSEQARRQIYLGTRTAPGDGLYVQIVGVEGVFVVDAQLLRLLPAKPDDWRDTALADLRGLAFDRIVVSNANTTVELQQPGTNQLWRLVTPMSARADNLRLRDALQKLHATRVMQFITDAPTADADAFGFHNAELELTLAHGTNVLIALQFGKSPTNDSTLVYARRIGAPSVFTVERESLRPWLASLNEFRDPHLVTLLREPAEIQVAGDDAFTLQRSATNAWRLVDSDLPVDAGFANELLLTLVTAPIQKFADSITPADLPQYGLAEPGRRIILRGQPQNGSTNNIFADLAFGESKDGLVYVRRADENPVYAINNSDYAPLTRKSWQLRDRQIWRFAATNAVRIVLQRGERKSELRRAGVNSWMFAGGSQGIVNGSEVEKTVQRLGALDASAWIERGAAKREAYGFKADSLQATIELKDGTKYTVEFGSITPDGYPYAAVPLNGETWIFEFPLVTYKYLEFTLLNPSAFPQ